MVVLCPFLLPSGNDGGQVTTALYSYRVSWPCMSFTELTVTAVVCAVLAQAFLAVHRRHLTKTVMVIAG